MEVYKTIYARVVMCLKQNDSAVVHGADLLTLSETSTWLGSKHKRQATASVKVQMLDVFYRDPSSSNRPPQSLWVRMLDIFYWEHIIVCK